MNKAVFLDRDGVINHDPGKHTFKLEEFTILPDVWESLKIFRDKGYKLVIITNQSGIARGYYGHEEVAVIHNYLRKEGEKHQVTFDGIYYSPNHESVSKSLDRKPGSLMVERALHQFNLDPNQCLMIGDKARDIECANGAGVKGIQIPVNSSILQIAKDL